MNEPFHPAPPEHIKKERERARKLRKTAWWNNKISDGICYICKQKVASEQLTMEHLVPLIRGGLSIKNNIVACCKPCNSSKGWRTIIEKRLYDTE